MAKIDFEEKEEATRITQKSAFRNCDIHGCPRFATIYTGLSANCRYHFGVAGKNLSQVTLALNNHAAEVDWFERLLLHDAEVEYVCGDLKTLAPENLKPLQKEKFKDYRTRIEEHIKKLLKIDTLQFRKHFGVDRKKLASGDGDSFQGIGEILPEF